MERDMEAKYEEDLKEFYDHGEVDEDWCSEEVVSAISTWIRSNIEPDEAVLSIGCGNAMELLQLFHHGYSNLTGVDRSSNAIQLAKGITSQENAKIRLEEGDILSTLPLSETSVLKEKYKFILDRGLYDTISVRGDEGIKEKYLQSTGKLLQDNGLLMIAAMELTEEELKQQMEKCYKYVETIPTPKLKFGGKEGHDVTVLAFSKASC